MAYSQTLETRGLLPGSSSMRMRPRRSIVTLSSIRWADIIVEELMEIGRYEQLVVCDHGVRHGALVEETFGRMTPA